MVEKWFCETCNKFHLLGTWRKKHGIENPWLIICPSDFDNPGQQNLFFEPEGEDNAKEEAARSQDGGS